jgi:hypothetical protein
LHLGNTRHAIASQASFVLPPRLYFAPQEYHDESINNEPAINRWRRGTMNELVERRAARAGIDAAVARATVGAISGFQRKKGPADKIQSLIGTRAGADDAVELERSLPGRRTDANSLHAPSYS